MESNDKFREEHQNARKRKFQEHPEQANDQPDEEGNDFELDSLQREDLIKLVKETKKELKMAKKEAEESDTEAKRLAKKLEEQQQQNLIQHGNGQNGAGQSIMAQRDDSIVQQLSMQITKLQEEKEELNGELGKKLAKVVEMHQEIEEKTKLLAEKANEIDALLSQLNELREEEDMLPNKSMKVQLPLENWTDLLPFVPRRQLVKIVSKIHNRQFAKILQFFLHKIGEVTLGEIEITEPDDEFEIERPLVRAVKRHVKYLLPDVPIPGNVKSFKSIEFSYLNKSVIQFMQEFQRNGLLANLNLAIHWLTCGNQTRYFERFLVPKMKVLTHLLPLIESFNCIDFIASCVFDKIVGAGKDEQFSDLFMKMLEKTRCIGASYDSDNLEPHKVDLYCRWLYTPREDAKPRVLYLDRYDFFDPQLDLIDRIKKDFLMATNPVSFFIRVYMAKEYFDLEKEDIEMSCENGKTKEKLLTKLQDMKVKPIKLGGEKTKRVLLLISRYPTGAGKQWIEENEREALDFDFSKQQRQIHFDDISERDIEMDNHNELNLTEKEEEEDSEEEEEEHSEEEELYLDGFGCLQPEGEY